MKKGFFAFVVFMLMLSWMTVIVSAEGEQPAPVTVTTITVEGGPTKGAPKEAVELAIADGIAIIGRVTTVEAKDGVTYRVVKRTEFTLEPPATRVIVRRLSPSENAFGGDCLLTALSGNPDQQWIQKLEDVASLTLGPGEVAEIVWEIPVVVEPTTAPITEAPETEEITPYINPNLVEGQIVFSIEGIGRMENIHGHIMPSFENTAPIIIQPRAEYLGAFDLFLTRWSGTDGKELMLYSIPVATWQRNETSFDATNTGAAEYCINWLDKDSLMLCDPGPFPEFQITGKDRGWEAKTFFAIWQFTTEDHTEGQWIWLF